MGKRLRIGVLVIICGLVFAQGTTDTKNSENFCILLENGKVIKLNQSLASLENNIEGTCFTKKEILHRDYGKLIWKSHEPFIADSRRDIIEYSFSGVCVQGYRFPGKIHTIILNTNELQLVDPNIRIGKPIPRELGKPLYHTKEMHAFQIGQGIDNEAILQLYLDSNGLIKQILISNKVE